MDHCAVPYRFILVTLTVLALGAAQAQTAPAKLEFVGVEPLVLGSQSASWPIELRNTATVPATFTLELRPYGAAIPVKLNVGGIGASEGTVTLAAGEQGLFSLTATDPKAFETAFTATRRGVLAVLSSTTGVTSIYRAFTISNPPAFTLIGRSVWPLVIAGVLGLVALALMLNANKGKLEEPTDAAVFDPTKTWMSNLGACGAFVTGVSSINLIEGDPKTLYITLAALFAAFLAVGPLLYRFTLDETSKSKRGWFIAAATLTLVGTFGSLVSAGLMIYELMPENQHKLEAPLGWTYIAGLGLVILGVLITVGPTSGRVIGRLAPEAGAAVRQTSLF